VVLFAGDLVALSSANMVSSFLFAREGGIVPYWGLQRVSVIEIIWEVVKKL
jgi:hypothetical protein